MPGTLRLNHNLLQQQGETPEDQARRVFISLKKRLEENPQKKIALLYAANNHQAVLFHEVYQAPPPREVLPTISGGGQALLYRALIKLINQETAKDPSYSARIRVLPIATSISGGSNCSGNIVAHEMIERDLGAVKAHLMAGYDIDGIPDPTDSTRFSIGGGSSEYWYETDFASIMVDGSEISQGQYVQLNLLALHDPTFIPLDAPLPKHQDQDQDQERTLKDQLQKEQSSLKQDTFYAHATQHSGRYHFFKAKPTNLIPAFQPYTGDVLKTKILIQFKANLEIIKTKEDLEEYVREFKENSPDYKVLKTGQGITTRLLGLQTDSVKAVEKLIQNRLQLIKDADDQSLSMTK